MLSFCFDVAAICVCTKSIQQRGTKEDDASNFLDKEKKREIFWLGFRVFLQSELFIKKLLLFFSLCVVVVVYVV